MANGKWLMVNEIKPDQTGSKLSGVYESYDNSSNITYATMLKGCGRRVEAANGKSESAAHSSGNVTKDAA
ncbi:MAG TPA: hypothetical protein VKV04_17795 [Verrucomicrobiae bacterium]|nr:hypothetical protein [Verrucomicrobiae bacterium]